MNSITKSSLYICPLCHAITALPYTVYGFAQANGSKCITCNIEMRELEDDFDMDDITDLREQTEVPRKKKPEQGEQ